MLCRVARTVIALHLPLFAAVAAHYQATRLAAAGLAAVFAVLAALECYRAYVPFRRDAAAAREPSIAEEFR